MAEYVRKADLLWLMDETKEDRLTREVIENHPTIDIVHCYECKHQKKIHSTTYCSAFGGFNGTGQNDFFCRHGERKE